MQFEYKLLHLSVLAFLYSSQLDIRKRKLNYQSCDS